MSNYSIMQKGNKIPSSIIYHFMEENLIGLSVVKLVDSWRDKLHEQNDDRYVCQRNWFRKKNKLNIGKSKTNQAPKKGRKRWLELWNFKPSHWHTTLKRQACRKGLPQPSCDWEGITHSTCDLNKLFVLWKTSQFFHSTYYRCWACNKQSDERISDP